MEFLVEIVYGKWSRWNPPLWLKGAGLTVKSPKRHSIWHFFSPFYFLATMRFVLLPERTCLMPDSFRTYLILCFFTSSQTWFFVLINIFGSTGKSWFKKPLFFFLKSRVVWFKKDICIESKNRSSEKNVLFRWICNLRSFLNREFTVLNMYHVSWFSFEHTVFSLVGQPFQVAVVVLAPSSKRRH